MGLVSHNGVLRRLRSRSQQLSAVSPLCPEGLNLVDNDNRLLPVTESSSRLVYPVDPDSRPELSAQLEHVTSSKYGHVSTCTEMSRSAKRAFRLFSRKNWFPSEVRLRHVLMTMANGFPSFPCLMVTQHSSVV